MSQLTQDKIQHYLDEIEGPEGVYSSSHITLHELCCRYGSDRVDDAINLYFRNKGENENV